MVKKIFPGLAAALLFLLFISTTCFSAERNWLKECASRQVKPLAGKVMLFHYQEKQNNTYHSPEPWQTLHNESNGLIWLKPGALMQADTVKRGEEVYVSKLQLTGNEFLSQPYWSNKISNVSRSEFEAQPLELSRYSPSLLISAFLEKGITASRKSNKSYAVYSMPVGKSSVELWINKSASLLTKVVAMKNNDLWGDVTTTIFYRNYDQLQGLRFPKDIVIENIHGIRDTVNMEAAGTSASVPPLLMRPEGYKIEEDQPENPTVAIAKAGDHLYRLTLPHTNTQVTLVEFSSYFMMIDVPLSSENGELVLGEIRKINPNKPVKYYAFGHHHPWYLGGVRPFIRAGATVLCTKEDMDYVNFIATAPHTIKPDSLQLYPAALKTELIDDTKTISEDGFEVRIFHIGNKSKHTNDYMLFYIPSEKTVIEDDLAWISETGPLKKANPRQAGLYGAIKDLGLDVTTVIQHWPVGASYGVKSSIPFSELEETVNMK